jgi:hypothetical protein
MATLIIILLLPQMDISLPLVVDTTRKGDEMARKITKNFDYWFLTKDGKAVWVNVKTGVILVERDDHLLHEPDKNESDEIVINAIFNAYKGG